MELKGKKAFITGASSGLGLAISKALIAKGCFVYLSSRPSQALNELKSQLTSVEIIECDVTDAGSVQAASEKAKAAEIVINNAGIWLEGKLESYSYEKIAQTLAVNLTGAIYVTRAFLPYLLERNTGAIVNVSSTSGLRVRDSESVYDASKWGLRGFTDALKEELKETDINVMGFYPGGMQTGIFEKAGSDRDIEKFMKPEDVADVLVYNLERPSSMVISDITVARRH